MARVTLGPSASEQWLRAPEHLAMVLARYRAAAALIGSAEHVLEVGCGEGIGARLLANGREWYVGIDIDADAIASAESGELTDETAYLFEQRDVQDIEPVDYDAVVALDVIEHVEDGAAFLDAIVRHLTPDGVCVIGTPNAAFDHLASARSRAAHVVTYSHARLHALMAARFRLVQSFGMQDTALHLGHPDARHYLLLCGVGPR